MANILSAKLLVVNGKGSAMLLLMLNDKARALLINPRIKEQCLLIETGSGDDVADLIEYLIKEPMINCTDN